MYHKHITSNKQSRTISRVQSGKKQIISLCNNTIQCMPAILLIIGHTYFVENMGVIQKLILTNIDGDKYTFQQNGSEDNIVITDSRQIISEIPKPKNVADKYIYHVTSINNLDKIVELGLVPHTILDKLDYKPVGMDTRRNAIAKDRDSEIKQCLIQIKDCELNNKELYPLLLPTIADILLGAKGDFVYGTQNLHTIVMYIELLNSTHRVVLRWEPERDEDYFMDLQDENAIKTLNRIAVERLEYAFVDKEYDVNLLDNQLNNVSTLTYKKLIDLKTDMQKGDNL